jgi:hypothetical protein
MILQTNSYIVPREKRAEHARLVARFRQCLARLGCDHFECYEQVGANWNANEATGRFVQIMRFRDRKQQQKVQGAERSDPAAQALIKEFCDMINFPYQQQQGLFVVGFYNSVLAVAPSRVPGLRGEDEGPIEEALTEAEEHSDAGSNGAPPANGNPPANGTPLEDAMDDIPMAEDVIEDDESAPRQSPDPSVHRS